MQSLEAAQWISLSAGSAHLTLYAGDMNTEPSDVPYNILRYRDIGIVLQILFSFD